MFDRRTLPLSALKAFEAAARHLHLGRAGEELGVTHSAISHQIKALEEKLGIALFSRAKNRLQLSAEGRRLYESVSDGFDRLIAGVQDLDPDSIAGELTIGCTHTSGASWALRHICAFQEAHPQVKIRLLELAPRQKETPRNIDVAICYGRPDVRGRAVRELASPSVYPVGSPKLLHRAARPTKPEHLGGFTLLHDKLNSWRDWFASAGVAYPEEAASIYFDTTFMALSAARMGHGVALCNPFETQEDLREGVLIHLLDHAMQEASSYFLVSNPPDQQTLRARLFEDWLLRAIADSMNKLS
jgi:LysR family glycine cleavage system transcriptional activator